MTADFAGWWNWIFIVPFVLGALMVSISVLGIGDDDGDADGEGFADDLLENLHLDGIPPLMLLQNFLLWFGLCGWIANRLLNANGPNVAAISIPVALVGGLILSIVTARFLARFTPDGATAASHRHELEGRVGEAIAPISASAGSAFVRDGHGTLHQIAARSEGEEIVAAGSKILVVAYEEDDQRYRVKAWRDEQSTPK